MEFEIWWLLAFPLFFVLGWLAARVDIKQVMTESRALPNSYFRGLNFLLNEQPDKAIEAFLEVVKLEPETIDLHFALGALFRRRGELDRAIRMHENLLEREGLAEEQRLRAQGELGQDYLKAGLLDRAEEVFGKLLQTPQHGLARTYLLEIYVQEKDWQKAIDAARELEKDGIAATVLNLATIKPLDTEAILALAKECGALVTVEEHQVAGGMGSAIAEFLSENTPTPIAFIGVRDRFGQSGTPDELLEHYGMGVSHIKAAAVRILSARS